MKSFKPLLTACLAAFAVTLLWSALPFAAWQKPPGHSEVAVFKATPALRLTNRNLVDVLIAVQLNERLSNAQWSNGVLSIDMKVRPGVGRPSAWFSDIEKLVRVSFLQLENVKRVLIRIVEERPESKVLLAAVDVRKSDSWLLHDMDALAYADPVHDVLWRERLRVSFTSAWEERFGQISGFSVKPASISQF
ncbi:hypothetical protein L1N85_04035 [Paenibacillus alkaliterrae]|nr:hypothetical protein [Paenibacillus alkaliterrae]